jgi:ABC-type branched-subunit amino acid transport system permease subunit
MATIINNPSSAGEDTSVGLILGIILAVVVAGALFVIYGLPAIRDTNSETTIIIPDVIPDKIETNATTP